MSEVNQLEAELEAAREKLARDLGELRVSANPKAGAEFVKQQASRKVCGVARKVADKVGLDYEGRECVLRKCPWLGRVLDGDAQARKQLMFGALGAVATLVVVSKLLRR